jgi:uncharacterized protein YdhG (YjbR/CyaY superfamily)
METGSSATSSEAAAMDLADRDFPPLPRAGALTMRQAFTTIDDYIIFQPPHARAVLESLRGAIREAAPDAVEAISYNIPAFKLNGKDVVSFAGWKQYVSLYPVPTGDAAFQARIAPYRAGKGTLRFPLREPIPLDLVRDVVRRLIAERHSG